MATRTRLTDAMEARLARSRENRLLVALIWLVLAIIGGTVAYVSALLLRYFLVMEYSPFEGFGLFPAFAVAVPVSIGFVYFLRALSDPRRWGARLLGPGELPRCRHTLEALQLGTGARFDVWVIDSSSVNGFAFSRGKQKVIAVTVGVESLSARAVEAVCACLVARLVLSEEDLSAKISGDTEPRSQITYRPSLSDSRALEIVREPLGFARGLAEALGQPSFVRTSPLFVAPLFRPAELGPYESWLEVLRLRDAYRFCKISTLTSAERSWLASVEVAETRLRHAAATFDSNLPKKAGPHVWESALRHPGVVAESAS